MFSFKRLGLKISFINLIILFLLLILPCNAQNSKINEFDTIRAELSFLKDKNSPNYLKVKQKLDKFIVQNKIDYSYQNRLVDIYRLMQEQKFNSAIYELNDLIDNNIEVSKCYELLGDICVKTGKTPNKIASYYKKSIQQDYENIAATYKLAKLYLREKKNIYGIEYLKQTVLLSNDIALLSEIEDIIKNKITPNNRYEANNLYETLGQIYVKTNRIQESYEAFSKALQLNPKDIYIKYYLSELFYQNGEINNVIALYDSILKDMPSDNQIKISKANFYLQEGNYLSANKEYLEILSENPESKQAKYGIFKIYQNKLPLDEILKKVNANNKTYLVNEKECLAFAAFLDEVGENKSAQEYRDFAKCLLDERNNKIAQTKNKITENKNITQPSNNISKPIKKPQQQVQDKQKQLKEAQLKAKKLEQEKLLAKKKLEQEKLEAKKIEQQKLAEQKLKQKQEQERIAAQKLKEKQEQERIAAQKLKEKQEQEKKLAALKKQKEYEERKIKEEQQKAYEKDPKKYQEYKKIIDNYSKIEPKTSQIYTAIANTYKQMGEPTNALNYYKKAQKLDPTNSDIYFNLGLIYMELNSFETARYNLVKAINLDSENSKAANLLTFVNQKIITQIVNNAYEKFENKNFIEAFDILNEGIKKYPKNAQLYYYRALACDSMNRNAAQIMDLQKSIELDPTYYMAYYQLGVAYEKIKDERNALVAYEKFLSIEPDEKDLINEIQQKVLTLGAKYY